MWGPLRKDVDAMCVQVGMRSAGAAHSLLWRPMVAGACFSAMCMNDCM